MATCFFRCALLVALIFVPSFSHASTDELTPWEKAYLGLEKTTRASSGSEDQVRLVSEGYDKSFGNIRAMDLSKVSSRDLHVFFKASARVVFYEPGDGHLSDMRDVFEALQKRKAASRSEVAAFYSSLFLGRKFDEMSAFYQSHPSYDLPVPVSFEGRQRPERHAVLDVAVTGSKVSSRTVDLSSGEHIVVIAHPQCHFTRNAVASIEADPSLAGIISMQASWVAPADRNVDVSPFQEWNKVHRDAPISIAYTRTGWPEVRVWQTPTFLFFKDGKVVGEVVGWPKEGNAESLRIEISKLGLPGAK